MAGAGPAPNPQARRRARSTAPGTVLLPQSGYSGNVPDWPLTQSTMEELIIWAELWKLPQANAWERFGWAREVALYSRWMVRAEGGNFDAAREARLLSDRLGLSPLALLRLRWEIRPDEEIPGHAQPAAQPAGVTDIRTRVKAVDTDAVEGAGDSG